MLSKKQLVFGLVSIAVLLNATANEARAEEAAFTVKQLTLETALNAAKAALEACRKEGYQVAVAVTDRAGIPQVLLRDRFAGAQTVDIAIDKAWTAVSFRTDTLNFAAVTLKPMNSGARHYERVASTGGGVPIEAAGNMFGAIGVSGSPGGKHDDSCARSGIDEIMDAIAF